MSDLKKPRLTVLGAVENPAVELVDLTAWSTNAETA